MFTGKGVLVTKGGLRLEVTYEYVETGQFGRAGRLYGQRMKTPPQIFEETFNLECEDGVAMIVVISQISDSRWVFFGRESAKNDPCA